MAYYNGFPATYQQMYPTPYQQTQVPVYAPQGAYQGQNLQPAQMSGANPQPAQMLTPPTIRAEIVQIEDEAAADKYPLGAGQSQMFITRAEDKIIIKTMGANGPMPLDVYEKRPPAPPAPVFDPGEYVRKDELEWRLNAFLEAHRATSAQTATVTPQTATRRAVKRDREDDE